jgi:hypothetical protein
LSLAAARGGATAACHSTCTQELAACKRTCPGGGPARRDCRAACAERSTCTAPGARIRTLAYVVSECTTDPQGRSSLQQKLVVRRGNCDPVTVMETAASTPVPDPLEACRVWGESRHGATYFTLAGVFQRLAVLPDGSGVVFEVMKQWSLFPALTPEPPRGEGIFFVRADGRGEPRRLGPASRQPTFLFASDPLGTFHEFDAWTFPVSPNGRSIALIDLGPDTAGQEAPQVFLLDLRSGRRKQLTHQSRVWSARDLDKGLTLPSFLDGRTIGFYGGSWFFSTWKSYRVKIDGSGYEEIPAPTLIAGARVVAQFAVTGARPQVIVVRFLDRRPTTEPLCCGGVTELFLSDGKDLLQLTNFNRTETGIPGGFIARGRVFFVASADPLGENPAEICQIFSVNTRGGDLRQLTRLPSDGRAFKNGCFQDPGQYAAACTVDLGIRLDRVTGTVLFGSSCDPVGGNPFGDQLFAMRPDGSGLRQLTAARGRDMLPDGTLRFEIVGPFAYPLGRP